MAVPARALDQQFRLLANPPKPVLVPDPPSVDSVDNVVGQLRAALPILTGTELIHALDKKRRDEILPTMLEPFDTLLGGGLPRGKMVEIAGRGARFSIVMAALASATAIGEAAALIDLGDHLDPQIAEADGVDLKRLLWVRPKTMKDAVMAAEMVGSTGFQLVVLDAGLPPLRGRRAPNAAWVRLGRMAEAHGNALLISTPYPLTGTASEAVVRSGRARPRWIGRPPIFAGMEAVLTLEKHRHLKPGKTMRMFFDMDAAQIVPATRDPQPATRSGGRS